MLGKTKDSFVNLKNARHEDQLDVMKKIEDSGDCPFCPENLSKYHKEEILRRSRQWVLTRNQWPYKNTRLHLLVITNYHAEKLKDLKPGAFDELQEHIVWAEREYQIEHGGVAMRFGDAEKTGATVKHLHVHLIAPNPKLPNGETVRFKISD